MIAWLRNLPIYQEPAHLTAPTRRSHPAPGRPNPGAIAQIASPNGHRHPHSRRATPIHDHVAWCAFVVLQGVEFETLSRDDGDHLTELGRAANRVGDASGFAPPGDIHRVHNTGGSTAISLHVYGADLGRGESSVRRVYDLPVARRGLVA